MQALFVDDKYKFKGYIDDRSALNRIRQTERPTEDDLRIAYRMFNYVIPAQGKDVATQRAKLFNELKKNGYGALLDTNDSIYGGFHTNASAIVFDMEQIALKDANRVTTVDKKFSELVFIGRKTLGL